MAKEILKSCWKMNFSKHNKFKSYLDFSLRTRFYLRKETEPVSVLRCEFYEIFKNQTRAESILLRNQIRSFGIYELEMDQRLTESDELSLILMEVFVSLQINLSSYEFPIKKQHDWSWFSIWNKNFCQL